MGSWAASTSGALSAPRVCCEGCAGARFGPATHRGCVCEFTDSPEFLAIPRTTSALPAGIRKHAAWRKIRATWCACPRRKSSQATLRSALSHTLHKCSSPGLNYFTARCLHFCPFCWRSCCLKWPRRSTEVLPSAPKHTKAGTRLTERTPVSAFLQARAT